MKKQNGITLVALVITIIILIILAGITIASLSNTGLFTRAQEAKNATDIATYCPKCKHKLNILDLIPVFSYIFLGGKCRYCKEKIRPRYLILETISGLFFVVVAYLMGLSIFNIETTKVIEYSFFALYFTFIVLMAGIDKEYRTINKPVLMYGVIISIMYIVYLYIIEKTSIYRYVIYLTLLLIILILDTIRLKKKAKNSYTYSILMVIIVMAVFTGEYTTIASIVTTLLSVAITLLINKLRKNKTVKTTEQYNKNIKLGLYLSIANILYFILILSYYKFI